MDDRLRLYLEAHDFPEGVAEYRFHPTRKWRFDYAWPKLLVALEMQGVSYGSKRTPTRHQRGEQMEKDYEKALTAMTMGWRVVFLTWSQLGRQQYIDDLKMVLDVASLMALPHKSGGG